MQYTVESLMEALKKYPSTMPVFVSGYEDGYDDEIFPAVLRVAPHRCNTGYSGAYDNATQYDVPSEIREVLVLQRGG